MRILVISQYFSPEEFRINDVVKGLLSRGHKVTILTGMPNYPSGRLNKGYSWFGPYSENFNGGKIIRAPLITRGKGQGLRLALNYLSFAFFATVVGLVRCTGKYDVIFVCQLSPVTVGIPARVISGIRRIPIVFWVQDLWPESLSATGAVNSLRALAAVRSLVRWIYRGCSRILVQSQAFFEPVEKMGVAHKNIGYFPNGAEPLFQPQERAQLWQGPKLPDGFRIMFAGNIGKAQSFETLLSAAEKLKAHEHIHWIIVGDGREAEWVKREVERRNLQACFHMMGRHRVEDMPDWFAQADVMLASLTDDPIFALTVPAKIQSYLACAKPIIASLNGEGVRVVEAAQAGVGVPSQNAQALADAVLKLSHLSDQQREELGASGRKYFDTYFDRELLLNRLECWLTEVAGE